jgi:hypothetical protein
MVGFQFLWRMSIIHFPLASHAKNNYMVADLEIQEATLGDI